MQIYRGLPIATNKLSEKERKSIPHHLFDCLALDEEPWTVRQFYDKASRVVNEIRSRGKVPILVGGSQYYIQSLLFPNKMIEKGESEALSLPRNAEQWPILDGSTEGMMDELRKVDPRMAMRWHPKDRRKIRRSLEICLQTGRPASEVYLETEDQNLDFQMPTEANFAQSRLPNDTLMFWTHASTDSLNERLDQRVESMVSQGLLDEVCGMHDFAQSQQAQGAAVDLDRGIWIAIGYKEFLPYMMDDERPESLRAEGIERTKIATRQYAKRQTRWIRLKLVPAMAETSNAMNVFLCDASSLSGWAIDVDCLALKVTKSFLEGCDLPLPMSLSNLAAKMLVTEEKSERVARHCDACDKTMMSAFEWTRHLKSKGHRAVTRPKTDWRALYPNR